jgi:signal transduction histidine kinase
MAENQDIIPSGLPPLEVLQRLRHELKHPFNTIQGSAQLLSENESLDEKAREHIERIQNVAVRLKELMKIVDDYLESQL